MGKKEQVLARAIFVLGSLWAWSATSRGRPPRSRWRDGGLALLAVVHMVLSTMWMCGREPPIFGAASTAKTQGQTVAGSLGEVGEVGRRDVTKTYVTPAPTAVRLITD